MCNDTFAVQMASMQIHSRECERKHAEHVFVMMYVTVDIRIFDITYFLCCINYVLCNV